MYVDSKVWNDYPSNAELIDRLAKLPLANQPGTTWDYSHSTDVLGLLVEVITDKSLYEFEKARVLDPRGMKDTSFYVTDKSKQDRIVEPFPNDRSIGVDADFNDPRVAQKWESGGGGMVGTTMDYARFAQMLLNGGTLSGKRILGPKTVAFMTADHLSASIAPPGRFTFPGRVLASVSASRCARTPVSRHWPVRWASSTGAGPAAPSSGSIRKRTCSWSS